MPSPSRGALLLIDIQYDFLTGSLAVPSGVNILTPVYRLMDAGSWDLVIASQDYHPKNHISFASRHDREPFTLIDLPNSSGTVKQELWPDHCVQGSKGAEIEEGVKSRLSQWEAKCKGRIVRKGEDREVDEYSAFRGDALHGELGKWLQDAKITELFVAGLATDFCVRFSALEALRDLSALMKVYIVKDAVQGVNAGKSEEVLADLEQRGASLVTSDSSEVKRWLS